MKKYLISLLVFLAFVIPATTSAIAVSWDRFSVGSIRPLYILDTVFGNIFTATSTTQASTFPYASTTAFSFTSTSTGSSGINLSGGCFSISNVCITAGGTIDGGTTGQVAYYSATNMAQGTSTIFITPAGNVGVGTTTPTSSLVVNGISGQQLLQIATSTNQNIFTINQNGNVGINVSFSGSSPKLFVQTDATTTGGIVVRLPSGITGGDWPAISISARDNVGVGNTASMEFQFTSIASLTGPAVSAQRTSGTAADLLLSATQGDARLPEMWLIGQTGNVGVGTSTPWGQLSASSTATTPALAVQQNSTGPAAVFLGGSVGVSTTSPANTLSVTGGYISVDSLTGGYKIDSQKFIYASSTNFTTVMGLQAGTGLDASSTWLGDIAIGYQALNTAPSASTITPMGNIAIGYQALKIRSSGVGNTVLGYASGGAITTGSRNTLIGYLTGNTIAGAGDNTYLGYQAGAGHASNQNTIIGSLAVSAGNNNGALNTVMGYQAGRLLSTGANNLFLGANTASTTTTGTNNVAIGYDVSVPLDAGSNQLSIGNIIYGTGINGEGGTVSTGKIGIASTTPTNLLSLQGGSYDISSIGGQYRMDNVPILFASSTNAITSVGGSALANYFNTSSTAGETAVGFQALGNATSSVGDTAVGYQALKGSATITSVTGQNTGVGYKALTALTSGFGAAALGYQALSALTTGQNDIGIGNNAGLGITNSSQSIAIGNGALNAHNGSSNVAIGQLAFGASGAGNLGVAIGNLAGFSDTSGAKNVFIGAASASTTATGSQNIALCYDCALPSVNGSNQLNIGNIIFGTGLTGEGTTIAGSVGIASSTPWGLLSVLGTSGIQTPIFAVASSTGNLAFMVSSGGHIIASSTNPVLSTCGTAPTMVGSDAHGTVTAGAAANGCTVTFQIAYSAAPTCVVTDRTQSLVNAFSYTTSVTALTVTETGLGGTLFDYVCEGNSGSQ